MNGRMLAVSDLHGRYDIWQMIKEYLEPDDTLYILGDCCDRGPKGWEILKEVINHPQCILLKGNHEDMFARAVLHGEKQFHDWNGGKKTRQKWKYKDGGDMKYIYYLKNLQTFAEYTNKDGKLIYLSHAGFSPSFKDDIPNDHDIIWDRYHLSDYWDDACDENIYCVFGHTPIPYISSKTRWDYDFPDYGILWFCKDKRGIYRKCCIDCGAFFTGHAAVLDLDTFEQYIFQTENCGPYREYMEY